MLNDNNVSRISTSSPKNKRGTSGLIAHNGFSTIELLFSIIILVLLATIVFVSFSKFFSERELDAAVEDVVAAFNEARSLTLASHDEDTSPQGKQYGVWIDTTSNTVEIFSGANHSSGTTVKAIKLGSRVSVSASGSGEVTYERLSGSVGAELAVTITSQHSGAQRAITVYVSGAIEVQ